MVTESMELKAQRANENPLPSDCHRRGFAPMEQEYEYWVEEKEGQLPADLSGTIFYNGPGRLQIGEQKYGHWFDGDGMVCALTFKDRRLHFKNKFVRTLKYRQESAAGKILYRGLGTQRPGGFLNNALRAPANVANTNIIYHGDKLLALWEGGKPYELDPATLDTLGQYRYYGKLSGLKPFSAHCKISPKTKQLINFGIVPGIKPKLSLYKVSAAGQIIQQQMYPLKFPAFCHDFAVSEHYAIFFISPLMIKNTLGFLTGFKSIGESVQYDPSYQTEVWLISLDDFSVKLKTEIDPFIVIHYGNAYEQEGRVNLDLFQYDNWNVNSFLMDVFNNNIEQGGDLYRYSINPEDSDDIGITKYHSNLGGDFPTWNWHRTAQSYNYLYANVILQNGTPYYFNGIEKIDLENDVCQVHDCGSGRFTSEALFVPRKEANSEDDGYLISTVYDYKSDCNEILIIDAKDFGSTLCRAKLKHFLPFRFHGSYVPRIFI